jgi:transposase
MAQVKDANFNQIHLFPPAFEDYVPADHPARFIRELVDSLDIKKLGISLRKSDRGNFNYAEKLYLRVWLYGWMKKMRSSRVLEQGTYDNLGLMWLAGMHHPDHNSLWRFFKDNKKQLKKLFKAVLQIAINADLVGFVLQAVDGTKIKANAQRDKLIELKDVKTIVKYLDELADHVERETDESVRTGDVKSSRMPDALKDRKQLKKIIKTNVRELEKESGQVSLSAQEEAGIREIETELSTKKQAHMSVTDPESRMMKCGSGKTFGFNGQTNTEAKNGFIVAADVISENTDNHHLVSMLDQTKENTGRVADESAADAGYFSGEQVEQAEEKQYSIIMPESKGGKLTNFHVSKFTYDPQKNVYICPMGACLAFESKGSSKGKPCLRYRCLDYETCPHRDECCSGKSGRTIYRSARAESLERHRHKMTKQQYKELLKRRKVIAEPPFHVIKNILGFRQWTVRGLENVRAQWYLICTAYNLKKLYSHWRTGAFKFPVKNGQMA